MLLQIGCSIVRREGERAAWLRPRRPLGWTLLLQHPHDVALLHDQELLPVDLHLGARPLAKQHLVLWLQIDGHDLAALIARPGTDGDNLALLRLLGSGVGHDDAPGSFGFAVNTAHDDTVMQRTKLHRKTLSISVGY